MNEPNPLKPLLEDAALGDELRAILDSRSAHEPAPGDLARLGQRLAAALPGGALPAALEAPAPGALTSAGSATAGMSSTAKVALVVALASAVGVGGYLARGDASSSPSPPSATVSDATTLHAAPAPMPSPSSTEEADASALHDVPSPPASPSTRAPSVVPSAAQAPPLAEGAPAESLLLSRAHDDLLNGHPEKALAITEEHAKVYPHGALAQEREVIAIESLVAFGRREEARRRAALFHRAYPDSSHGDRIDRIVRGP